MSIEQQSPFEELVGKSCSKKIPIVSTVVSSLENLSLNRDSFDINVRDEVFSPGSSNNHLNSRVVDSPDTSENLGTDQPRKEETVMSHPTLESFQIEAAEGEGH